MKVLHYKKFTNLQIVGDLSASTNLPSSAAVSYWDDHVVIKLAEGVSRCWSWIPFFQRRTLPQTDLGDVEVSFCAIIISTITYEPIPVKGK